MSPRKVKTRCRLEKIKTVMPPEKIKTVIPTGASRRFFFSFAPAKESAREVEESLFDLGVNLSMSFLNRRTRKNQTDITDRIL